ncbi:MAG: 2,3,4,5-tetrahydropyridine-2,6-dicarboxylate N-succinyltransferase [Candidatus Eremiobacteraeota bacterium]|nr:2,3,4,5-tetrahydropyridine-2,6-dicarboxylate N-succinyltransferase [Candidatus Eremiobacteraeota bacterium]
MTTLELLVRSAFAERDRLADADVRAAVEQVIEGLDEGKLRVAEFDGNSWIVNDWIQQAIILYFAMREATAIQAGPLNFWDKIPLKKSWRHTGVRVVPPGVARYGSYLAPGVILMPAFVNIGARVGEGSMIDTWATVGSGAQIGAGVHISGGVGIGGVLEPPSARPVIIEDGAFVGSRCIIVEGVFVEREAVLGAGVVLTASTPIIDVTGKESKSLRGRVPRRSVVIPGMQPKQFPAGEYATPCALIVGRRSESTDRKTSLNAALREHGLAN